VEFMKSPVCYFQLAFNLLSTCLELLSNFNALYLEKP